MHPIDQMSALRCAEKYFFEQQEVATDDLYYELYNPDLNKSKSCMTKTSMTQLFLENEKTVVIVNRVYRYIYINLADEVQQKNLPDFLRNYTKRNKNILVKVITKEQGMLKVHEVSAIIKKLEKPRLKPILKLRLANNIFVSPLSSRKRTQDEQGGEPKRLILI